MSILFVRTGNPGERKPDVRAKPLSDTGSHLSCGQIADHRAVRHAEQLLLHRGGVADNSADKHIARPWDVGEAPAHEPASDRLRNGQRQPALAAQIKDDGFHGVFVGSEHELVDLPANHCFPVIELGNAVVSSLTLRRQPDLQAVPTTRQKRERRCVQRFQLVDDGVETFVQTALTLAPSAQNPRGNHSAFAAALQQVRDDRPMDHVVHLMWDTRYRVDHLDHAINRDRTDQAGRRATGLRNDRCADRHLCLLPVALGHHPSPRLEHRSDDLNERRIFNEFDAHHGGDRAARQIVMRRAKPAAHDDSVRVSEHPPELYFDPANIVADLDLYERVDPMKCQLAAHPGRVRIDDLAEQQLGSNSQHITTHPTSVAQTRRSTSYLNGLLRRAGVVQVLGAADQGKPDGRPQQTRPQPGGVERRPWQEYEPDSELLGERLVLRKFRGRHADALAAHHNPVHADDEFTCRDDDHRHDPKNIGTDQREHGAENKHLVGERVEKCTRCRGATPPSDVTIDEVAEAQDEPEDTCDPCASLVIRNHPEHDGRQQQTPGGDGVRPAGDRQAFALRYFRCCHYRTADSSMSSDATSTPAATRSGPSASTISTSANSPTITSSPTWIMPSISGASR